MSVDELLQAKRQEVLRLAGYHGAHNVKIFGSAARGEATAVSDVDLLVEMEEGRSLFDLVGLRHDLEELLGRKVDIVEPEGLHWYIRDKVLNEAVPL